VFASAVFVVESARLPLDEKVMSDEYVAAPPPGIVASQLIPAALSSFTWQSHVFGRSAFPPICCHNVAKVVST
jgi:hypothetical protein